VKRTTFFAVRVTSGKFVPYADNMKFSTQHLERISIHVIIYIYFYLRIFLSIIYNKNMLIII
jgi:hypothetical protein